MMIINHSSTYTGVSVPYLLYNWTSMAKHRNNMETQFVNYNIGVDK